MKGQRPVRTDRLYYGFRLFLSEFLSDKTAVPKTEDLTYGTKEYSDEDACGKEYIFKEEELAEHLAKRLREYSAVITEKLPVIFLKTKTGRIKIDISDINFIRRENGRAVYHMKDKRTFAGSTLRTSFKTAVKDLTEKHGFILAGASRALNPERIESFYENTVRFADGEEEFLSDRLYYKVKKEYDVYMKRFFVV